MSVSRLLPGLAKDFIDRERLSASEFPAASDWLAACSQPHCGNGRVLPDEVVAHCHHCCGYGDANQSPFGRGHLEWRIVHAPRTPIALAADNKSAPSLCKRRRRNIAPFLGRPKTGRRELSPDPQAWLFATITAAIAIVQQVAISYTFLRLARRHPHAFQTYSRTPWWHSRNLMFPTTSTRSSGE